MGRGIRRRYYGYEIQCNLNLLLWGCALIVLGLLGTAVLTEKFLGIYRGLQEVLLFGHAASLFIVSIKAVAVRGVQKFPLYIGAFFLHEGIRIEKRNRRSFGCTFVFTLLLMLLFRWLTFQLYRRSCEWGISSFVIWALLLTILYLKLSYTIVFHRLMMLFCLLMSIQWLEVAPALTHYGFGLEGIEAEIKMVAGILGVQKALYYFALWMSGSCFFSAAIQFQALRWANRQSFLYASKRETEQRQYQTRLKEMKQKHRSELQLMIHHLKTPLSAAQGLLDLTALLPADDVRSHEYIRRAASVMKSMNQTISLCLHENQVGIFTTAELMETVLGLQMAGHTKELIEYQNISPKEEIRGNKLQLAHAVHNIVENAIQAVDKQSGKIYICVKAKDRYIQISVRDNGTGISESEQHFIFKPGYSGHHSSGMGLPVMRQIIDQHGGWIAVKSTLGEYTEFKIYLKGQDSKDAEEENTCA